MSNNDCMYKILKSRDDIFLQFNNENVTKTLSINISNGQVAPVDNALLASKTIVSTTNAKVILGIIEVKKVDFIIYVKTSDLVGSFNNSEVYRINEVSFIEVNSYENRTNKDEINSLLEGIKNLLKLGFFYSFGFNLTNTLQNQSRISKNTTTTNMPLSDRLKYIYETKNIKYFFNYNLYKKFLNPQTELPMDYNFIVPIICGYFNTFTVDIENNTLFYYLISRRSQNFAGTRYLTRGIDDEGHVANFCETEMVIKYNNNILSFSQVRGSAPVFFQQIGLMPKTDITRNKQLTVEAFNKHIMELNENYNLVYIVNLLNEKKSGEAPIISELEKQVIMRKDSKNLRYYFFDMQNMCKGDNYDEIDSLMEKFNKILDIFQFYCEENGEIIKEQKGVFRTNCLDCLDRTNVIQTRIAFNAMKKMLIYLNLDINNIFPQDEKFFVLGTNKFKESFKDIWADNGDQLSIQYAGTASTITTVTKTGKHDFFGMISHGIATLTRVYQGTFEDDFKQECFDTFLQKNISEDFIDPFVLVELNKQQNEFTNFNDVIIWIGTWNISGQKIHELDLNKFMNLYVNNNFQKKKLDNVQPDFYIFGFQEIVNITATNILINSNEDIRNDIKTKINDVLVGLTGSDSYVFCQDINLIGLYFLVFVKKSFKKNLTNVDSKILKFGLLMGSVGNKGAILFRFNINDSSFAFACSHLSAHKEMQEKRKDEMLEILRTNLDQKSQKIKFMDYDNFFIFGDLNIRLNVSDDNPLIKQTINSLKIENSKNFDALLVYDQFKMYQKETMEFFIMDEAPIKFSPTFKYIIGSNEYSTNNRQPGWCDRILYKKSSDIECLAYNRGEFTISDHRPVYGLYKVKCKEIDKEKRKELMNKIMNEYKKSEISGYDKNTTISDVDIRQSYFKNKK